MSKNRSLTATFVMAVALALTAPESSPSIQDRMAMFPKVFLWAWEREERLDFIDPREVGVAFLAKTIYLRGEQAEARPRFQIVSFPESAVLIAVVRLESDRRTPPALTVSQRARAVSEIAELAHNKKLSGVQVDFDARDSERAFYRQLLVELRRELPKHLRLSITALASWCIHDDWLAGLPVDEAVPMLFRMSADHNQVLMHLRSGGDFREEITRLSLGISTDEPIDSLPSGRRVYLFRPKAWTEQSVREILSEVKRWQ